MALYAPTVLIHNYNEDRFGRDLVSQQASAPGQAKLKELYRTPTSIAHASFQNPKNIEAQIDAHGHEASSSSSEASKAPATATTCLEQHLLFGHAGEMTTTKELTKHDFCSSNQYFFRDPKNHVTGHKEVVERDGTVKMEAEVKALDVEAYYEGAGNTLKALDKAAFSKLASERRERWAVDRVNMKSTGGAGYRTTYGEDAASKEADPTLGLEANRIPRVNGMFTAEVNKIRIQRQLATLPPP